MPTRPSRKRSLRNRESCSRLLLAARAVAWGATANLAALRPAEAGSVCISEFATPSMGTGRWLKPTRRPATRSSRPATCRRRIGSRHWWLRRTSASRRSPKARTPKSTRRSTRPSSGCSSCCRIKSISTDPAFAADCRACAEWHVEDLRSIGFEARADATPGHPIVVGHDRSASGPSALFYGHYDVQPVDPLELWDHDPFDPFIETRPNGTARSARAAHRTTRAR